MLRLTLVCLALPALLLGEAVTPPGETTAAPRNPEDFVHYQDLIAAWPEPVQAAVATFKPTEATRWAWTYRVTDEDGTRIQRWDPRRPEAEQDELLEVDGRAPTEKDRRRMAERQREEREASRPKVDPERRIRRTRAWLATLEFTEVARTAESATYAVRARPDEFAGLPLPDRIRNRVLSGVEGRLEVSLPPGIPGVRLLELSNPAPVHPYFSVHLREVRIRLENAPVSRPGEPPVYLPTRISGRLDGRFLLLGRIDEAWDTEFLAYEPVEP